MEECEVETDALGHVNSVLVVGQQQMLEEGAVGEVLEEEEEASVAGEEVGVKVRKGDFEQTLEVSLNDTPGADFNILHSQAS